MKLKNKKTGELGYFCFANWDSPTIIIMDNNGIQLAKYNSLAELNEEWEDYEEPKEYWFISDRYKVFHTEDTSFIDKERKSLGNYFETKEEAEKAVEKLKAWKRLKDKQFKFYGWNKGSLLKSKPNTIEFACDDTKLWCWEDIQDDLDLLFGGEE